MQEYFWSLCVEINSLQAAIWTVKDGSAQIVCTSNPVVYEDDETLVKAADEVLSNCVQLLPEEIAEPTKCVFGVSASWVVDGQIEKAHLEKIKLICNKLSLTPTGFVVLSEAISYFEKSTEKTPLSAILVGVYAQSIDVTIFRLGNLTGSVNVARSTSITDDVTEGLARFENGDALPSRFLVYGSNDGDLEEFKQELIKADWERANENIKFLHTPQVEIFNTTAKMAAISLAGAAETGTATEIVFEQALETAKENKPEMLSEDINNVTEPESKKSLFESEFDSVDPASLGFGNGFNTTPQEVKENIQNTIQNFEPQVIKNKMQDFKLPKFKNTRILKENFLFVGVIALFFILVIGFCYVWFVPKATVTIFISPQKINETKQVKFDTNASGVNASTLTIPAKIAIASVSSSKTKSTTGTTVVGTPSKGSVTFYNVGGSTTISAGTTLSASSLNFSLDNDVQIASASGAAAASSANGNITAQQVGADSNLASGTYFTVGNFSSSLIQAKNGNDLAGGSSQEVAAVSSDDATSLQNDLKQDLTTNGTNNLKSQLNGGNLLIPDSVALTISSSTFDNKVGAQASTVKLNESAKVTGTTFTKSDMNNLAKQIFASEIPSGYTLTDDAIDYQPGKTSTQFIINLLPVTDANKIKQEILGKNINDLKNVLGNIQGLEDVQVTGTPKLLQLPFLPHVVDHITIQFVAK
ncbi:MAG TPA: baseplate J/gp47 family protein [Patescibacteria group bacterium]|nr:baseplate J/gp47 family protein [Patescibacteria group bacterium]